MSLEVARCSNPAMAMFISSMIINHVLTSVQEMVSAEIIDVSVTKASMVALVKKFELTIR